MYFLSYQPLKADKKSGNIRKKIFVKNKSLNKYLMFVQTQFSVVGRFRYSVTHSRTHTHTHTHRKRPEKDCVSEKDSVEKEGESELSLAACV